MKKFGLGIFIGLILIMTGCLDDDDSYSLGDMWVGFGVIQESGTSTYQIIMDNGDVLEPLVWDHYHSRDGYTYGDVINHIDDGDRVLVNYTVLDDDQNDQGEIGTYYVRVNSLKEILMKGILDITPENEDSIGNDPVVIEDYWLADSLLTFKLKYWGYNEIHFLNLVKAPGDLTDQPFELELRHNANDDEEAVRYTAYVSFSLNALRVDGQDSVSFIVTSTDYDENGFSEEFVYNYGELGD